MMEFEEVEEDWEEVYWEDVCVEDELDEVE